MTQRFYFLMWIGVLAFAVTMNVFSQEQEDRDVIESFTRISVGSGIDLFLSQGEPVQVLVEADKSLISKIVTRVEGDLLKVYVRDNFRWMRSKSMKVYVTMPEITTLAVSGGADLRSQGQITVDQLSVECSGGADAYLSLQGKHVELTASGGADIKAEGVTESLKASASGGSDIEATNLKAQSVVAEASGGADVEVFASEMIKAHASGGGDVEYHGSPSEKSISKSGGGDVTGY